VHPRARSDWQATLTLPVDLNRSQAFLRGRVPAACG